MPGLYDEEEKKKLKRGKVWPSGKDTPIMRPTPIEGTPTATHTPTTGLVRGAAAIPGGKYFKEGMREAADDPTMAGRIGKSARTMITAPAVAGYELMRGPVASAGEATRAVGGFVGDVGKELFRSGARQGIKPPPETDGEITRPETTVLRAGYDKTEGTPDTPEEPPIRRGQPVQYGGLMRPPVQEEQPAQLMRPAQQLSDVAMPESIGDIARYKLESRAKKFDIEQGQKQQQAQLAAEAGQATGDIAEQELALKRDTLTQQMAKEDRATKAAEGKQAQLEAAQQAYADAETIEEKTAAAQQVNMLSGKGVSVPKKVALKDKTLSQKEASDAQQSAQREYAERTGSTQGFFEEFFQTNPVAFKANYGNLAPVDVEHYNKIIGMSTKDIAKQAARMKQTPEEYRNEAYRRYKEAGGK